MARVGQAGAAAHRARGLVVHLLLGAHLRVPVVHRDRHEHRAPRRQRRGVRRAGQRVRDVLRAGRLVAPLHQRVGHPRGVAVGQVGLQRHQRAVLLARGHHQRRLVGLRVEDRAHPVAEARGRVQVDQRRAPRRLGVPVRHPHRHRLLQAEHVAEVLREASSASAAPWSRGCRTAWSCPAPAAARYVASRTVLIACSPLRGRAPEWAGVAEPCSAERCRCRVGRSSWWSGGGSLKLVSRRGWRRRSSPAAPYRSRTLAFSTVSTTIRHLPMSVRSKRPSTSPLAHERPARPADTQARAAGSGLRPSRSSS